MWLHVTFSPGWNSLPVLNTTVKLALGWVPFRTAQKMKFSNKDFFSNCDQIHRKLRIWSHLLKKSLMEKFIFCAVSPVTYKWPKWIHPEVSFAPGWNLTCNISAQTRKYHFFGQYVHFRWVNTTIYRAETRSTMTKQPKKTNFQKQYYNPEMLEL